MVVPAPQNPRSRRALVTRKIWADMTFRDGCICCPPRPISTASHLCLSKIFMPFGHPLFSILQFGCMTVNLSPTSKSLSRQIASFLPMATLIDCPSELQRLFFEWTSRADLLALSRINRHIHAVIEPLLYAKVEWKWREPGEIPIIPSLRTILHRPELATHIQSVALLGRDFWRGYNGCIVPNLHVAGVQLDEAETAIKEIGVPYAEVWIRELRLGKLDSFVTLLLSRLHNLKYLFLDVNFSQDTELTGMMFRSALCEGVDYAIPGFQRLQHVSHKLGVRQLEVKFRSKTGDFLPLSYLPTVRHLRVSIKNLVPLSWPAHTPCPSTLTSLHITLVREPKLLQLPSVTKNLQKLQWDWYYSNLYEFPVSKPLIDLDQIAEALSQVRNTLTYLTITGACDRGSDSELPVLATKGSYGGLVNLDGLERLEAPVPFLVGFSPDDRKRLEDAMPKNLQCVTFNDDFSWHEQYEWDDEPFLHAIQLWLGNWKTTTPPSPCHRA